MILSAVVVVETRKVPTIYIVQSWPRVGKRNSLNRTISPGVGEPLELCSLSTLSILVSHIKSINSIDLFPTRDGSPSPATEETPTINLYIVCRRYRPSLDHQSVLTPFIDVVRCRMISVLSACLTLQILLSPLHCLFLINDLYHSGWASYAMPRPDQYFLPHTPYKKWSRQYKVDFKKLFRNFPPSSQSRI